ncbi:MAG: tRNA lysidine(34) synthetase TilS [Bacteroidota bacterium]
MMNLVQRFNESVKRQHLFSLKDKLLLAVSGGLDSVVLCELCKQAGFDFVIAHCNFQLRGEESERDELFVKELGKKYAAETFIKKFDTDKYAAEKKISIQEAARELRYTWFAELLAPDSRLPTSGFLLTAHHADDNNETLLMNFFRGTGLHGLTGIPVSNDHIRRPLLDFSKQELAEFAKEHGLKFVEDSSNQSSKYTRNFFRNELIPAISNVYPQVNQNLQDNINRFKEIEKLYQLSVGELKKKICRQKGNEIHIPVKQLMGFNNKALVYEIISPFGFTEKQVEEVVRLAESDSGKYIQSPGAAYRIIKHRRWFIISPVQDTGSKNIIIEAGDKETRFSSGTLGIETTSNIPFDKLRVQPSNNIVSLDAKDIGFPLLLRKRKTGDYFYPLGMKKKKKLNRFLIDQRLSATEKENTWVIESDQRIIWVVGHRIDERFKLTDKTKQAICFTFLPAK